MLRRTPVVLGSVFVAWVGFAVHNLADLPGQRLWSPETAYPSVPYLFLAVLWFTPARRLLTAVLLGWCGMQLIGGAILSVLPLPFVPFEPAQTVYHYTFHAIYGLAQLPALAVGVQLTTKGSHRSAP